MIMIPINMKVTPFMLWEKTMKKLGLCVVGATVAVVMPMSVEATDLETIP